MEHYQSYLFTNECTIDCLKNNIKIYIKIALTCFGTVITSSGNALSGLANVTLVKVVSYGTLVCDYFIGDVAAYIGMSLLVCVRRTALPEQYNTHTHQQGHDQYMQPLHH